MVLVKAKFRKLLKKKPKLISRMELLEKVKLKLKTKIQELEKAVSHWSNSRRERNYT